MLTALQLNQQEGGTKGAAALKTQLDELVAGECVRCGDAMIRAIDKPFIADDQLGEAIKTWYLCE